MAGVQQHYAFLGLNAVDVLAQLVFLKALPEQGIHAGDIHVMGDEIIFTVLDIAMSGQK